MSFKVAEVDHDDHYLEIEYDHGDEHDDHAVISNQTTEEHGNSTDSSSDDEI